MIKQKKNYVNTCVRACVSAGELFQVEYSWLHHEWRGFEGQLSHLLQRLLVPLHKYTHADTYTHTPAQTHTSVYIYVYTHILVMLAVVVEWGHAAV